MKTFRKTLALVFAIAFVTSAVLAVLLFNLDRRAFTAETYQRAFAREDFYNQLPRLMAQAITASGTDTSQLPIIMQGMSTEAWEGFIRTLLPPDVLKTMGDDVLNSTFAYLNRQSDSVSLNLAPVKTSMVSESGTQAVLSLFAALPNCTLDQIAQITFDLLAGGQIEFCNPPAELLPMLKPVIQGQMQFAASMIPETLTLATAPLQNDPREKLEAARLIMRLSLLLPIMLLLTLTALAVRSLSDWLNWWGVSFLTAGLIIFVLGIIGAPIFQLILEGILARQMAGYLPNFLLDFTGDFAAAMVRALLLPILWQGLVLLIIGGGMAGVGYFMKK